MKDLVLSLLSRGYSEAVQKTDGEYGRLEIYFEPEDYFNWKSQPPLLRITSSGRLLGGEDPTPPKTYSTRRGPLILYSEDLALSSCQSYKGKRKERTFRTSRDDLEVQLHTLQDLTQAILSYGKKQAKAASRSSVPQTLSPVSKRATKGLHSYLRPTWAQDYETQLTDEVTASKDFTLETTTMMSEFNGIGASVRSVREEHPSATAQGNNVYNKSGQARYQPRFLCLPQPQRPPPGPLPPIAQGLALRHSEDRPHLASDDPVTSETTGPKDPVTNRNMKTTSRTAVKTQMSPVLAINAQEEFTGWPEDQMVTQHLTVQPKDISGQWKQSAMETGGEEGSRSLKPVYLDSSLGCSHLSRITNNRRHMEGPCQQGSVKQSMCVKEVNAPPNPGFHLFHLPPIDQNLPSGSETEDHEVKAGSNTRANHKDSVPRLPDIHIPDISAETTGPKPPERANLKKVFLLLPSQMEKDGRHEEEREDSLPEKEEDKKDVLSGGVEQKEEAIMRDGENESLEQSCRLKDTEQFHLIWFEPEEDKEHQTTPGLLPALVGRKGPGKQSSMALYRQDPYDSTDQSEPQPGVIRGSLPLELRECEKGRALGTLIMGPAGEIIRLSLWDSLTDIEDHPVLDDATTEHVLRVMRSGGVAEQPWAILLEGRTTQTTQTERTNVCQLEVKPDCKEQPISYQEDRVAAKHSSAEENDECYGANGTRMVEAQACAPEQESWKLNHSIENQPNSKALTCQKDVVSSSGGDPKIKRSGRTQSLQPEAGATPGSPKHKSTSASSAQKPGLSTPTAGEERFHKAKSEMQTSTKKDNIKTQFRKAGGGDVAERTQIRKVKKEGEVDQHAKRITENKHTLKRNAQANEYSESEETVYTADTTPGLVLEKKKTAEGKKPKVSTSQPKESTSQSKESTSQSKESTSQSKEPSTQSKEPSTQSNESSTQPKESKKPQNKVKKKNKGQAAFVVGKPRKSQEVQHIEKEADRPGRHDKTTSDTENKPEDGTVSELCCSAHGQGEDIDLVSVDQEYHTAALSLRTHSSAEVSFRTQHSAGVFSRTHSSAAVSPRTYSSAATSPRTHSSAMVLTRTHSSAMVLTRTHSSAMVSTSKHSSAVVSSRTHSSSSIHTASSQRTSIRAEVESCCAAPLSLTQLPSNSAAKTHHSSSKPAKSESSIDAKRNNDPISVRDSKATALAEKAAAQAEKAERRRLEVERKRKEKEEEQRRLLEREDREERIRLELEEEQRQRAEQARLRQLSDEEERRTKEEREKELEMQRQKRERAEMERERRRQEEKRRLLERLQRERQEEERRRAAELRRQQQEEEAQRELERRKLEEMEESERVEYLRRKHEEEEERRKAAEERRRVEEAAALRAEEEARLLAQLTAKQMAALERQLWFSRSLFAEAEGLEQTHDISRPWVFSYFALLKLLGLVEPPQDLIKDVL